MKLSYLIVCFCFPLYIHSQVQFAIACNQKIWKLEVIVSGRQEPHHLILKDQFPNQAVAEAYLRDNPATLKCQDPSKPAPRVSTNPPSPSGPPRTTQSPPSNKAGQRILPYTNTRLGATTFKSPFIYPDYGSEVDKTILPSFYLGSGKDIIPKFSFNIEFLFNFRSREGQGTQSNLRTNAFSGGMGLQLETRFPLPIEIITPYIQGSLGYIHSFYFNKYLSGPSDDTFEYNFGSLYYDLGLGTIIHLDDYFGLFLEGGYLRSSTIKTFGAINSDVIESQGYDAGPIPNYAPYNKSVKNNKAYLKFGIFIRVPGR